MTSPQRASTLNFSLPESKAPLECVVEPCKATGGDSIIISKYPIVSSDKVGSIADIGASDLTSLLGRLLEQPRRFLRRVSLLASHCLCSFFQGYKTSRNFVDVFRIPMSCRKVISCICRGAAFLGAALETPSVPLSNVEVELPWAILGLLDIISKQQIRLTCAGTV